MIILDLLLQCCMQQIAHKLWSRWQVEGFFQSTIPYILLLLSSLLANQGCSHDEASKALASANFRRYLFDFQGLFHEQCVALVNISAWLWPCKPDSLSTKWSFSISTEFTMSVSFLSLYYYTNVATWSSQHHLKSLSLLHASIALYIESLFGA